MGEVADKLGKMKESKQVAYLGNLRSLVDANTIERFKQYSQLLTDYNFIEAKINHVKYGIQPLIEDYELIEGKLLTYIQNNVEIVKTLKIIKQALQLSAHVINQDTKQLAGQLAGRLLPFGKQATIQKLLQEISQTKITWLRPLTASLTPPGNGLIRTLTGHSDSVRAVAFSSDSKYVVSGSKDNTIKVWEFATANVLHTLTDHSNSVNTVTVSSDGRYIVTGSDDYTIKIWELATANVIHTLTGHSNPVNAVALSSDDKYIVSGSYDNTIKVWELSMAKEIVTFISEGIVSCCAITPDNATIIAGDVLAKIHFLRLEGMEVQS